MEAVLLFDLPHFFDGEPDPLRRKMLLPLDAGEIRHRAGRLADAVEEPQAVGPKRGVFRVDRHLVEEGVHGLAQAGQRAHRALEILRLDGSGGLALGPVEHHGERLFLDLALVVYDLEIGRLVVSATVLLLLDAQDVSRAAITGEQVLAILGVEEAAERFDADGRS